MATIKKPTRAELTAFLTWLRENYPEKWFLRIPDIKAGTDAEWAAISQYAEWFNAGKPGAPAPTPAEKAEAGEALSYHEFMDLQLTDPVAYMALLRDKDALSKGLLPADVPEGSKWEYKFTAEGGNLWALTGIAEEEPPEDERPEPWKYPAEPAREGYEYVFNPTWGWIEQPIGQAEGMTEYQRETIDFARQQAEWEQQQATQAAAESGAMSEWQQWQSQFLPWQAQQEYGLEQQGYGLEQQGLAQQQQNTLAQMAAQPASWLQHAATSGTPPVVQPWMLPMMSQEYPELAGLRAGQPIPGWPEQFTGTNAAAYGGQPYAGQPYQPQGFEPFSYTPPPSPAIPEIPDYQAMYAEWQQQQEEARLQEEYARLQAVSAQPTLRSLGAYGGQAPPSPSPTPTPTPTTTRTATAVHQAEEEVRKRQLRTEPTKLTGGAYIPGFQYGGWVTQPTTARLAENEPELVTPLSSMTGSSGGGSSSWFDRLISAVKTAGQEGLAPAPALAQTQQIGTPAPTMQPLPQTATQPTTYQSPAMPAGPPSQTMGQYPLGSMPELTRPSRQYQARMGPTALQQYYAYKQARTGANPEETAWRLWNMAPPGGGYRGLTYMR